MRGAQGGIFALGTGSHSYLEFDLHTHGDPLTLVQVMANLGEPRMTTGGVNLVVSFRSSLWARVGPQEMPAGGNRLRAGRAWCRWVHDTPMRLQRTLTPGFKLLRQGLVEPTDGTGTGSNSHKRLGHFSHLMGTCPGHKHLRQSFSNVRDVSAIALKGLGVELPFTISGDEDVLEPTGRCHEIARGGTVAIPFALGATLSPTRSNELIELFTHHRFYHYANGTLSQRPQVLMEDVLFG